jgi:predicted dinucleotide-binding enzyme
MATIAFIGLGNMGGPMAANLVKAGHKVIGFDLLHAHLEEAKANGLQIAANAAEAVSDVDAVITMLPAGKHVLSVYEDIAPKARKDSLFIDSSTIDVDSARKATSPLMHRFRAAQVAPQQVPSPLWRAAAIMPLQRLSRFFSRWLVRSCIAAAMAQVRLQKFATT